MQYTNQTCSSKTSLPNNLAETGLLNFDFDTSYLDSDRSDVFVIGGGSLSLNEQNPSKGFGQSFPSFYIDFTRSSVTEGDIRNSTFADPDPVQQGDRVTTTITARVDYIKNVAYDKATICSTPFLCGHDSTSEETISVPYVKKVIYRAEQTGPEGFDAEPSYSLRLSSVQTKHTQCKIPCDLV